MEIREARIALQKLALDLEEWEDRKNWNPIPDPVCCKIENLFRDILKEVRRAQSF